MTSPATIALLGTGIMGLPMGRHLSRAGFPLRAWNRSIDKAAHSIFEDDTDGE